MEKPLRKSSVELTLWKLGFAWQRLVLLVSTADHRDQERFYSECSTRLTALVGCANSRRSAQGQGRPTGEILKIQSMFDRPVIGGLRLVV